MKPTVLPSDVWVEILSYLLSLNDLRSAILSTRDILNAFYERRTALITAVLRAEITASEHDNVYQHAEAVAARVKVKRVADAIIIHEAIVPLLKDTARDIRFYKWCLSLCSIYSNSGASAQEKRQALLQRAYKDMLAGYTPNFDLPAASIAQDGSSTARRAGSSRMPKYCYAAANKLANSYIDPELFGERLLLEKEIFRRSAIKETNSLDWGNRIINTLRALQSNNERWSIVEASQFENHMYELCRQNAMLERSLFWARHLVSEYTRAGHDDTAISEQRRIMTHLRPGSNEYIAWARQLIVMHRRAGQMDEALAVKAAVWNTMTVDVSSYFGWARELASQYRQNSQKEDALRLVQEVHLRMQDALLRRPRDATIKYHAKLAALALVGEYEFSNQLTDAAAIHERFVAAV